MKKAKAGITPLVLIDEAQELTRDELKLVHYLLNFVSNTKVLLMFVLVGQPELSERISRFPSLKSRLVSSSVSGMTRVDSEKMIRFRWDIASKTKPPFTARAYDEIYRITKGVPRHIVKLCHSALLLGFLNKAKEIDQKMIKKASLEE